MARRDAPGGRCAARGRGGEVDRRRVLRRLRIARAAVDAAAAIQRALRDHRASTGFAIAVRIGLHTSDANRRGADYSGKGVHVAARVAALAGAGEILAIADTLREAGGPPASARRTTNVRGVTTAIELASVAWD